MADTELSPEEEARIVEENRRDELIALLYEIRRDLARATAHMADLAADPRAPLRLHLALNWCQKLLIAAWGSVEAVHDGTYDGAKRNRKATYSLWGGIAWPEEEQAGEHAE